MKKKKDIVPFSFLEKAGNKIKTGTNIKNVGTAAGAVGGLILGGPVILAGKLLNSKTIVEIGAMAAEQTANAGSLVGQVAQGLVSTTNGIVKNDKSRIEEGIEELTQSAVTVGSGIKNGVKSTFINGKDIYEGIRDGDTEKALMAATTIGKGVAAGIIGFGVDHQDIEPPGLIQGNHDLITVKSHVDSHYVHDYYRADVTHVNGYFRGGADGYDATKYVTTETAQNSDEAQMLSKDNFKSPPGSSVR